LKENARQEVIEKAQIAFKGKNRIPFMERNTTVLADMTRANPKSQSC